MCTLLHAIPVVCVYISQCPMLVTIHSRHRLHALPVSTTVNAQCSSQFIHDITCMPSQFLTKLTLTQCSQKLSASSLRTTSSSKKDSTASLWRDLCGTSVYMCVYVCLCVYMCVYVCLCVYMCVHMCVYVCMCIYVCVCVCMHGMWIQGHYVALEKC